MLGFKEKATLKSSGQVSTAISGTNGQNSAVATDLGLKRWVVVALRQHYNLRRI